MNNIDLEIDLELDEPSGVAFDRSARTKDSVGRLHVVDCKISKSNVCAYVGYEVPGHQALGLNPDKVYMLYRDRAALKAAAPSFENLPLLLTHAAVSASDPKQHITVGVVSNVRYEHPYLVGDIAVWNEDAIRLIESGSQRELSCGYGYRPDMTPGRIEGAAYDGRMLDIVGNHVALVREGRAGSEVAVGDSAPGVPMHVAFPDFNRLSRGR
jgi:uncharacterized protein